MGLFSFLKSKFSKKEEKNDTLLTYDKGLDKAKKSFTDRIKKIAGEDEAIPSDYFDKLEEILIEADVGVNLTLKIIEQLLDIVKKNKLTKTKEVNDALIDVMFSNYTNDSNIKTDIVFETTPTVLLVVGVNGAGKTTSIAKLAKRYLDMNKKVMLAACDTFRAGAVSQLKEWGSRLGIDVITGKENSDPSSVAYTAIVKAKENNIDLLIVDTAGRQQTKTNLMNELNKMSRVLSKEIPNAPHETFLILDATTGQNGVLQAKAFNEVTKISGAIITKMDGTSKGGILLSIKEELNIPVRFIGLGEKMDDLMPFDLDKYLHGLLIGESNER